MKVIDHWLDGATRVRYPNRQAPMNIRRFGVAHFSSGASARSSIDFWKTREAMGAVAHVIIDRDGTVYQVLPFNVMGAHAGRSRWRCPRTGKIFEYLNLCSIGVEFANAGDDEALARRWSKLPLVVARHKNGGPVCKWEAFPEVQIQAGIAVFQAITKRYNLDDLIGHDDIAPDRKNDPGPAFPMSRVRAACGFPV